MDHLDGRTAIVTGASRGIGAATALLFGAAGARVALMARTTDEICTVVEEIRAAGGVAEPVPCDVADPVSVAEAVATATEALGPCDILVNNAGRIAPIAFLADSDPADWAANIDTNLKGVYFPTRAVLPAMLERGGGVIVNISSGAASRPLEGWSAYCTAKAGAAMLTRAADLELRERGIRVVGLSPGTVATDMQRAIKSSGINRVSELDWSDHIPPEWPARCIAWLCGPEGAGFAGEEVSLRDEGIRRRLGLA